MKKSQGIPRSLPLPGQRIMKSVFAVFLCFVVYYLRGKQGIPFYSAIAVLQCMQPYRSNTAKVAWNRVQGTLIGAFWGTIAMLLELQIPPQQDMLIYIVVSVFVGVVLYSAVLLDCKQSAYFSCVVFLSITVNHVTDANPYLFIFNRVLDTLIGVGLGYLVNMFHLPHTKQDDILFVSGIDDTILDRSNHLSDYSRIKLNRLVDMGCLFTVSTTNTPASVRELMNGVNLELPIIAMDGAVLYDMKENRYLVKREMTEQQAQTVMKFLDKAGYNYFTNTVEDDLLVIYYNRLENAAEQGIYDRRRKSPYRNYVHRESWVTNHVIYLLVDGEKEAMETLYNNLLRQPWAKEFRFVFDDSESYPGYVYLKIYSCASSREQMLEELRKRINVEKVVTFGSIEGKYDVLIQDASKDYMVHSLKKLYEPLWFKKQH
jgi:hydroxymethylpyrimidine pyrophosphatase-like HAD family hydrolase